MEISLIRHGRSLLSENDRITINDFRSWIEKYDSSGVNEEAAYPPETIKRAADAKVVITSDLKRSVESARLLNPEAKIISDPLFRETELPVCSTELFQLRLRPGIWAVILRLVWFSGYSRKCESLKEAKLRAEKAAKKLIDSSIEYGPIVLVGHGFMNILIAKELKKKGWKGRRKTASEHWGCTTYFFA